MAQIGAVFVFCSSCKILYFASSVHPKNATAGRSCDMVRHGSRSFVKHGFTCPSSIQSEMSIIENILSNINSIHLAA